MSIAAGPNLVTSGLVFAYDMGNPERSWMGAPTTNLTPNLGIFSVLGAPTVTYVGIEDGWKKYSLSGTWTGGTYPYSVAIDSVSFTGGVSYTSGVFIKTSVPAKFATLFTGMNYVNEPMNNAGTSFSTPQADGSIFVGRTGFQYTSTTTQPGYLLSQPVVGQTFNSATDFIFIKNGQVQTGSITTPFTSGTRSNTQAILDLTGRNIITATNLTYTANGEFSFDGVDDAITTSTISGTGTSTNSISWCVWTRPNGTAGNIVSMASANPSGGWNMPPMAATGSQFRGKIWPNNYLFSPTYTIGSWHYVCLVFNYDAVTANAYQRLFVNGEMVAEQTNITYSSSGVDNFLFFGQANPGADNTGFYNGSIGAVQVYTNKALSPAEVRQNYDAYRSRYGL
jgi:hypothetical protein